MAKENKEKPVEAEVVGEKKTNCQAGRSGSRVFWGLILVAIGGIFIAENFVNIDLWRYFWPVVLIVSGLTLIIRSSNY